MRGAARLLISAALLCCGTLASERMASAQAGSTFTVTVPPQGKAPGKTKQSKNLSVPNNDQTPAWNGAPAYNAPAPYNAAPNHPPPTYAVPAYGAAPAYGASPAAAAQPAPPASSAAAGPNSARFLATYGSGASAPAATSGYAASASNAAPAAAGSAYGSQAATSGYAASPTAGPGYAAGPAATTASAASNAYATAPAGSTAYAPAPPTSAYAAVPPSSTGYNAAPAPYNAEPTTGGTYGTSASGGSTFTMTTGPKGSSGRGKHSRDIRVPAATVVAGNVPASGVAIHGSMVSPNSSGIQPAAYDTTTPTPPSFDARTLLKPKPKPKEAPHVLVHSTTVLPEGMDANPPDEDEIVKEGLTWKGEYELDKNEQVLIDAEGKPVPVLYTAKGKAVRPKNVKLSGRHPATILNGVLTVDGFPAKGHLNYAVQDMKFLYFSAPGIGTVVISPAPFEGGEEQKDAFAGQTLTVKAGYHDFALATERPILGKESAPAWVKLDPEYVADPRNPVMGYGMRDDAPYMWPGAIRGKAVQGSVDAPPIPVNMRPKMNTAPCPAGRICPE